jgi:ubiquinone biosynthesis protein COQ4
MIATQTAASETNAPAPALELAPPPPCRRPQWLRAIRALRDLLANPRQTEKAFEIFLALDGAHDETLFQRLLVDPVGRRLAAQRPSLIERLCDRAGLATLPAGSFGRAYLDYLDRTGLDPGGLMRLKSELQAHAAASGEQLPAIDPLREWVRDRGIPTHDLWHVLTDYGTDEYGEAALLAFSLAQVGGRANRLLVAGTALRGSLQRGPGFLVYLYRAWRRGRRAAWLPGLAYEELLGEPLEAVRTLARIEPAAVAHPRGILRGAAF